MKKYAKIAFGGVFTALCVLFLFIGSAVSTLDLTSAALGGLIVVAAVTEIGPRYSFGVYAAASAISLLILPAKLPAVYFALFSGYYPVAKIYLNRIKPRWLSYAARFALFNTALAASELAAVFLLNIESEPAFIIVLTAVALNVVFFVYDKAIEKAAVFYGLKIRKHIFKGRR